VTRRALPPHARRVVVSSGELPAGALPIAFALGSRETRRRTQSFRASAPVVKPRLTDY